MVKTKKIFPRAVGEYYYISTSCRWIRNWLINIVLLFFIPLKSKKCPVKKDWNLFLVWNLYNPIVPNPNLILLNENNWISAIFNPT